MRREGEKRKKNIICKKRKEKISNKPMLICHMNNIKVWGKDK